MSSYIMFSNGMSFDGYTNFLPNVKYRIKKEDNKYYYVANVKIPKIELEKEDFVIGAINEGRLNG